MNNFKQPIWYASKFFIGHDLFYNVNFYLKVLLINLFK